MVIMRYSFYSNFDFTSVELAIAFSLIMESISLQNVALLIKGWRYYSCLNASCVLRSKEIQSMLR